MSKGRILLRGRIHGKNDGECMEDYGEEKGDIVVLQWCSDDTVVK